MSLSSSNSFGHSNPWKRLKLTEVITATIQSAGLVSTTTVDLLQDQVTSQGLTLASTAETLGAYVLETKTISDSLIIAEADIIDHTDRLDGLETSVENLDTSIEAIQTKIAYQYIAARRDADALLYTSSATANVMTLFPFDLYTSIVRTGDWKVETKTTPTFTYLGVSTTLFLFTWSGRIVTTTAAAVVTLTLLINGVPSVYTDQFNSTTTGIRSMFNVTSLLSVVPGMVLTLGITVNQVSNVLSLTRQNFILSRA